MSEKAAGEKNWYVVHTYSGYENKVKTDLEKRIQSMEMEDKIFQIVVPMEEVVEYKDGKKKVSKRKVFPGYVLVEMIMGDDSWYVVRNTPGVTGFVSSGVKPIPLEKHEVEMILRQMGMTRASSVLTKGMLSGLSRGHSKISQAPLQRSIQKRGKCGSAFLCLAVIPPLSWIFTK